MPSHIRNIKRYANIVSNLNRNITVGCKIVISLYRLSDQISPAEMRHILTPFCRQIWRLPVSIKLIKKYAEAIEQSVKGRFSDDKVAVFNLPCLKQLSMYAARDISNK